MTVRAVEWKKPYTWWIAIEVTEDKVINLRLRDENNLIIWDEWDNEIYVDLQLPDWIKPTDAFPVWITTGRVLVADDWDVTGTIICAKTTSWDNIKVLYGDDNKLYVDNGTGLFKEVSFKADVDLAIQTLRAYVDQQLALKQDLLIAGNNITIDQNNVISATLSASSRFLSLWDCETWMPISFPNTTLPFEYETGDHYLVENVDATTNYRPDWTEFDWTASTTVETEDVAIWDMYYFDWASWLLQQNHDPEVSFSQIAWQPTDNTNLATALNGKQNTLTAGANITIDANNEISATDTTYTAGTNVQISNQNVISATDTTYSAGTNITIDANNQISATNTTYSAGMWISMNGTTINADEVVIDMSDIVVWDDWRVSGLIVADTKWITINDNGNLYKVWKAVIDLPNDNVQIYASNGSDGSNYTSGYLISWDSMGITSITTYTKDYFVPESAGSTGQVLKKTVTGYDWANEDKEIERFTLSGTSDTTTAEAIVQSYLNNKEPIVIYTYNGDIYHFHTSEFWDWGNNIYVLRFSYMAEGNWIVLAIVYTYLNNTITIDEIDVLTDDYVMKLTSYTQGHIAVIRSDWWIADWWAVPIWVPSWGNNWDVLTNVSWTPTWSAPSGWDVMVSTQTGNQFTPWMKIWWGSSSDYSSLTQDLNTLYMAY